MNYPQYLLIYGALHLEHLSYFPAVSGVFIVAAKRTAFGTYGGKLKDVSATVMQEVAAKAAIAEAKVDPKLVGSVVFGNVLQVCLKQEQPIHFNVDRASQ